MLKLENGIRIKKRALWVFALIIVMMTGVMAADPTYIRADTVIVMNKYGMGAPFLISWTPVWVFAMAGDIVPNLSKPRDIPTGRFISLRLHELPKEPPVLPTKVQTEV